LDTDAMGMLYFRDSPFFAHRKDSDLILV
jgi:hypothetical protein